MLATYSGRFDFNPGAGGPLRFDRQDAYGLLNLTAAISPPGKHLTVSFFTENLTQTHYAINRNTTNLGAYELVAAPRKVGGRLSYNF